MATQIKISELPLANESALSLAADDRLIFNNDNVNTQTIKFANFVDAICEQNLTFSGNCSFLQPITGPNGGDIQVGLDDLVDVQFQNVTSGQILQYAGTQWINVDVSDVALQLDSLSVETGSATGGGTLVYDDATGVFTFSPADLSSYATLASLSATNSQVASGGGSLAYAPATGVFTFSPADAYTKAESYSKTQVDTALGDKANTSDTYTKTEVDTALAAKASNVLLGVVNGSTNLGSFSGSIITPNGTVKAALQEVETAIENIDGLQLTDLSVGANGAATPTGGLSYNNGTGVFTYSPPDLSTYATTASVNTSIGNVTGANLDLSGKNTDSLVEGSSNLYYTEARADARAQNAVNAAASNYYPAADGGNNSNAIDNLIAALVNIGNNGGITDVTGLKTALAALARDNG